jgi:hypothetical protein
MVSENSFFTGGKNLIMLLGFVQLCFQFEV